MADDELESLEAQAETAADLAASRRERARLERALAEVDAERARLEAGFRGFVDRHLSELLLAGAWVAFLLYRIVLEVWGRGI